MVMGLTLALDRKFNILTTSRITIVNRKLSAKNSIAKAVANFKDAFAPKLAFAPAVA